MFWYNEQQMELHGKRRSESWKKMTGPRREDDPISLIAVQEKIGVPCTVWTISPLVVQREGPAKIGDGRMNADLAV